MANQIIQAAQEGIFLRFPDNIAPQRDLNYDTAVNMLLRSMSMAQTVPFSWSYIDKPTDGSVYLVFLPPNIPYVTDGIRYLEPEVKYTIPAGTRELEVFESKSGFIPNSQDTNASRVRRRYRLTKGGNPQLMLIHYTRGQTTHIPPALMQQPIRQGPMRQLNEPQMFVAGEKMGQKVLPQGVNPMHGGPSNMGPSNMGPSGMGPSNMPPPTIGMGMHFNQQQQQQQAMLAQQNSTMEALEQRRREQSRQQERGAPRNDPSAGRPPQQRMVEEDDSGDEVDQISSRTLALARYKRNHDWMNDVFNQAAFGKRSMPPKPSPYSIFSKADIEEKTAKLQAEIEAMQTRSAKRHADKIRESQSGSSSMGEVIST